MPTPVTDALRRTRQHHAIEHATIHLLSARHPRVSMAGLSDPWGFTLYGELPTEAIEQAVSEALLRLQSGEAALAIHPNCGTNLTTSIFLATFAGLLGSGFRRRHPLDRFAGMAVLMALALVVAQPLGMRLQRLTTSPAVADRWLVRVSPLVGGSQRAHRIHLA